MLRLHRVLHHGDEVFSQLGQVHLIAQRGAERLHDLRCIILPTVETAVNDGLDAMVQGLKQGRNDEGRDHDCDRVILVEQPLAQGLQSKNEAEVDQTQQNRQRAVDQRLVYEDIHIP